MSGKFLIIGPVDAQTTILLAHGAGGAMDSKSMTAVSAALAAAGFRVARFEFAYMAGRRVSGARTPPPRADTLIPEYLAAVMELAADGPLVIGGKSMGGRVASMVADELHDRGAAAGLLCIGYPFHPPAKPAQLRTAHLLELRTPTLICQGTRDEFGTKNEVESYRLSAQIDILWLEDGDHDLAPRKKISGFSEADHLATMAVHVKAWAKDLLRA
ncbi:alpha/beta family hydrolase [Rhizobium sp. Root1220]|uniref:alpha/beta hydrolase family protein n=1 Tax=Rhizobium sp. Root1220 TaxID=1736432 RepID=UPI0006F294BB|nr:alpha/beta family hydrolase [Rhizobium sp. Root1220]KQV66311.1 alpha/beta hydrolase [Rhizobium sp. Root1220]